MVCCTLVIRQSLDFVNIGIREPIRKTGGIVGNCELFPLRLRKTHNSWPDRSWGKRAVRIVVCWVRVCGQWGLENAAGRGAILVAKVEHTI